MLIFSDFFEVAIIFLISFTKLMIGWGSEGASKSGHPMYCIWMNSMLFFAFSEVQYCLFLLSINYLSPIVKLKNLTWCIIITRQTVISKIKRSFYSIWKNICFIFNVNLHVTICLCLVWHWRPILSTFFWKWKTLISNLNRYW